MATRYVRYVDLKPRYGIPFSRTHLKRLVGAGLFPAPVNLGPATIAWIEEDVLAYGERIRAERDAKQSARRADARDVGGADAGAAT
jgi:prophage regulatory protein